VDSQVVACDSQVAELDIQVAELDSQVAELDSQVAEVDTQVALENQVAVGTQGKLVAVVDWLVNSLGFAGSWPLIVIF
jgi:hypothetical protein